MDDLLGERGLLVLLREGAIEAVEQRGDLDLGSELCEAVVELPPLLPVQCEVGVFPTCAGGRDSVEQLPRGSRRFRSRLERGGDDLRVRRRQDRPRCTAFVPSERDLCRVILRAEHKPAGAGEVG
jgi:hypothetical protein